MNNTLSEEFELTARDNLDQHNEDLFKLHVEDHFEEHAEVHFEQHVGNHLFELQAENQISLMPTQG